MHRRHFLHRAGAAAACASLPSLAGCGGGFAPRRVFRLLNYNIYAGRNQDESHNLQRIVEVIRAGRPDAVALQEVDVGTRRNQGRDIAAVIAGELGMRHAFGRAIDFQGGQYGNAVLSRHPILASRTHPLDGEGAEDRSGLECAIAVPGLEHPLQLISVHLCHRDAGRRARQLTTLQGAIGNNGRSARIIAGDFNDGPDSPLLRDFAAAGWQDLAPESQRATPTFSSDNPRRRIDYIFAHTPFSGTVMNFAVGVEMVPGCAEFQAELALASDHLPMVVEFSI